MFLGSTERRGNRLEFAERFTLVGQWTKIYRVWYVRNNMSWYDLSSMAVNLFWCVRLVIINTIYMLMIIIIAYF